MMVETVRGVRGIRSEYFIACRYGSLFLFRCTRRMGLGVGLESRLL